MFANVPFHPKNKISFSVLHTAIQIPLKPLDTAFVRLTNSAHYNPVPYLPQVFAITIPRLFQVRPMFLLYAGRLGNLFIWILFIYLAIGFTPVAKWLFTMIALLPMSVFQASSLSPDAMTTSLAFLLITSIFRLAFDDSRKIKSFDLLLIALISVLLALSKNVYFFLTLLVFLIPPRKFSSIKHE